MRNPKIITMARLLGKTSKTIEMLLQSAIGEDHQSVDETGTYCEMVLDELQHVQVLVLMMTKELTPPYAESSAHNPQDAERWADHMEEE